MTSKAFQYSNFEIHRSDILLRGYDKTRNKKFQIKEPLKPKLYVPSKSSSEYKNIHGEPMEQMEFESPRAARDFQKKYADVAGFEVHGFNNFHYTYINELFGMDMDYDPSLVHVMNFDVEVAADEGFPSIELANKEVTAITCESSGVYTVFGIKEFDDTDLENVTFIQCRDEKDLLIRFIEFWSNDYPDVITGWNIEYFDIPYMVHRIDRILGNEWVKKLSPWSYVSRRETRLGNKINVTYDISGIANLDYLHLYKKFVMKPRDSYKLDNIAHVELNEKKIDYSEYESLLDLYKKDYRKFILYNIKDTELIRRLDDKLKLLELVYAIAYSIGVNYVDVLTTVRLWDVLIHNYLISQKIVVPYEKHGIAAASIPGGYVKTPDVGMYEWEVTVDLASLYPHLIMQYNISPETIREHIGHNLGSEEVINELVESKLETGVFLEQLQEHNLALAGSGWTFSRDKQGFLPAIMEKYFNKRSEYKKKMLDYETKVQENIKSGSSDVEITELKNKVSQFDTLQMAMKVGILNSGYGALLNQYFRWFDTRLGSSVTLSGQMVIKWTEKVINEYLNKTLKTKGEDYVITIDTDSCIITLKPLVDKIVPEGTEKSEIVGLLDKVCKDRILPTIHSAYDELGRLTNAFEQKMKIDREVIADRGIHLGKKHYILNMLAKETTVYAEPELKMMGISAIKSSTPEPCRDALKEILKIIMSGTEKDVQTYIGKFRKEFYSMNFEDVSFPRGVNGLDKYQDAVLIYSKGTPIHVRGSLLYNSFLKKMNLTEKYQKIQEGDKIKFCYLQTPNPLKENVIAVPDMLPRQFGLHEYIDYELQFEKGFLDPLKDILDVVGWDIEKRNKIDDFFS